ncbi:transcription factor bHLH153-like protein [Salvia divinorum]|uniref:Transcription factor bHLH153-like protein n=1 Tax=Salvia divinorum TaxID=28513 RepID=A0ABD1HQ99_SALDI
MNIIINMIKEYNAAQTTSILSSPHLYRTPTQLQGVEGSSLSTTIGVASSNGADIWAPIEPYPMKLHS